MNSNPLQYPDDRNDDERRREEDHRRVEDRMDEGRDRHSHPFTHTTPIHQEDTFDSRTSEPRVDPRIDPRVDPRVDSRTIDPRVDPRVDPRTSDPRSDPRITDPGVDDRRADPRLPSDHTDPRRPSDPPRWNGETRDRSDDDPSSHPSQFDRSHSISSPQVFE